MKKKIKIILLIIVVVIVLLVVLAIWYGGRITSSPKLPSRLDDPDLVYSSQYWAGLCGNDKGEMGGCYHNLYLYNTGKFVRDSGFVQLDNKKGVNPTVEKNLGIGIVDQIIKKIKDSGVMEKDCPPSQIMDVGWNYQINIDGVKKSFYNPPQNCQDIFNAIDDILNSPIE